jgi:zinc protease
VSARRPPVVPPQPWSFPEPTEHAFPNGLRLLAYDVPGQYVISVRAAVPLPLVAEPRDKEGVATLMARLLDEGTTRHTAEEFAELLERNGIALGAGMSEAGLGVDLDVPKRSLAPALDLLRQALDEPAFPPEEVRRHVRTRLAEIEQERALAPHRAAREFVATYFDSAERASRPAAGTAETVASVTRADIVAFHRDEVSPSGATVAVAGDLSGLDVADLVGSTLGAWTAQRQRPPAADPQTRRAADAARVVIVDRPGSVQTEMVVGGPGPDRRVEGWAAYPVLSFVIGGSPTARLDALLREDKGFTYGFRSTYRPRRRGGLFMTTGSVRAAVTAEALELLLGVLNQAGDGFTEDEVRTGVDFLGKTAPGRYATADSIADEAATMALDELDTAFTTRTLQEMRHLTPLDLAAAYRRFADGAWTIVLVGDASLITPTVSDLGLGSVSVVPA